MRKRVSVCAVIIAVAVVFGGCGKSDNAGSAGSKDKWEKIDAVGAAQNEASDNATAQESADSTEQGFSFADLADVRFEFCSGAGGWSTDMIIYTNGYFRGTYHDSEMGLTGEGYNQGSYYMSDFTGHFSEPIKVSDYVYELSKKDITYRYTPGEEAIIGDMRYLYSEAYGLENTGFRLYLPGTPMSELSEEVLSWVRMANGEDSEVLTMYVLENVSEASAFYSYSGFDRKADVLQQHEYAKNDYEAQMQRFATADMTQLAMNTEAKAIYQEVDSCLNYIWDEIYYTKDTADYKKIQSEQVTWISDRDAQVKAAADQYKGGSIYEYVYYQKMAELTIERCGKLVEYLK